MQLTRISGVSVATRSHANQNMTKFAANPVAQNSQLISKAGADALKLNGLNFAKTIAFTSALHDAFEKLDNSMVTCKSDISDGEVVGSAANVNKLLHDFQDDLPKIDDAVKTTIVVNEDEIKKEEAKKAKGEKYKEITPKYARTQIKLIDRNEKADKNKMLFEMAVRETADRKVDPSQLVSVELDAINYKGEGTKEQAYVLNTKGNLMPVVEDGNMVLLTDAGEITKIDTTEGSLHVASVQKGNTYKPFTAKEVTFPAVHYGPSIGEGAEIVIGMENGRFVNEIKESIKTFVKKVEERSIILPQFVAAPNAKDTQLVMLAGGFGSRAEYTNAASSAIFHNEVNGSQSTKGVFRTPTGLTPMETTFVTLHKAGLLDCSAGKLKYTGDDANIKFYLNKARNKGNGGYTVDLSEKMKRDDRKQIMVFPNDSMSRMTNAVSEANRLTGEGKAAIAIVAKKVKAADCVKTFGIMRLGQNNEILDFAEKPAVIAPEFKDSDGFCVTNTFQFAVSNEALKVLEMFEPFFSTTAKGKETRDWSSHYIPIIQTVTQVADVEAAKQKLSSVFKVSVDKINSNPADFNATFAKAKEILGDRKLMAVPTSEPWADCGTLNAMYHTIMQIVNGDFALEEFEITNARGCVNTKTGLVSTNSKLQYEVEKKYAINGQVMAVERARKINPEEVADIPVTVNE